MPRGGERKMETPKILVESIEIGNYGPFKLYELDSFDFEDNLDLKEKMGIYVFTTRSKDKDGKYSHKIHYVGKTTDYAKRFYHHHKADELKEVNPNCLAIYSCKENEMDALEVALIEKWKPELNDTHNPEK